jgi:hypothetical protein
MTWENDWEKDWKNDWKNVNGRENEGFIETVLCELPGGEVNVEIWNVPSMNQGFYTDHYEVRLYFEPGLLLGCSGGGQFCSLEHARKQRNMFVYAFSGINRWREEASTVRMSSEIKKISFFKRIEVDVKKLSDFGRVEDLAAYSVIWAFDSEDAEFVLKVTKPVKKRALSPDSPARPQKANIGVDFAQTTPAERVQCLRLAKQGTGALTLQAQSYLDKLVNELRWA